jgi:hypothetical protein
LLVVAFGKLLAEEPEGWCHESVLSGKESNLISQKYSGGRTVGGISLDTHLNCKTEVNIRTAISKIERPESVMHLLLNEI